MSILHWFIPWEPSVTVGVCCAAAAILYVRGARRSPISAAWPRQVAFWSGLAITYFCLHTQLDYYAEHEFFINRVQQFGLQHLGPFLIALSYPGAALRRALPLSWRTRLARNAALRRICDVALHPWLTIALFVGLMAFWLWPSVNFAAMLDWRLYRVMNWSMVLNGLLYWRLILDPRPKPPARLGPGLRVLIEMAVMVPQILIGAYITFSHRDLYPVYELCGRAFAGISQSADQYMGGLIIWIPSATMSAFGALLAFRNWLRLSARGRLPIQRKWKDQRKLQQRELQRRGALV